MGRCERNSTLPDRIEDAVLGTIRFKFALDGMDEYEAKVKLGGRCVTLSLYTDENGSLQTCIVRARKIVERFPAIQTKLHRYIEKTIFPSYNETWRENEKPITFKKMIGQLKLSMISTHPEPEATFWFDAADLFWGHILQLRMAQRNQIVGHDMPG